MELQINAEGQLLDGEGNLVKIGEEEATVTNAVTKDKMNATIQERLARQTDKIKTLEAQAIKTPDLERLLTELRAEKTQMEESLSHAQAEAEGKVATQLKTTMTRAEQAEANLKVERESHVRTQLTNAILGTVGDKFINPAEDIVPRLLSVHKREPVLGEDGKPTGKHNDLFEVDVAADENGQIKREFVPVDKAVEFMAANPKFAHYVRSRNTGGPGSSAFSGIRATKRSELLTPKDKSEFITKHGLDAFKALPA
ncbi:hypothetical protein HQ520_16380 [bacterium]|nr:hypothetical protein [bacterium]